MSSSNLQEVFKADVAWMWEPYRTGVGRRTKESAVHVLPGLGGVKVEFDYR